jgi:hypothetical protein
MAYDPVDPRATSPVTNRPLQINNTTNTTGQHWLLGTGGQKTSNLNYDPANPRETSAPSSVEGPKHYISPYAPKRNGNSSLGATTPTPFLQISRPDETNPYGTGIYNPVDPRNTARGMDWHNKFTSTGPWRFFGMTGTSHTGTLSRQGALAIQKVLPDFDPYNRTTINPVTGFAWGP